VLEVVRYEPATGEAVVVAGFGSGSDWLRNVAADGPTWVDFGHGPRAARHRDVGPDEAVDVIAAYERRYPAQMRHLVRWVVGRLAGLPYRGTEEDRRRVAEVLPMIAFTPRS
jgi:hypothetical protein